MSRRCRIGWHAWQQVVLRGWEIALVWPEGRRCRRCGAVHARTPFGDWITTDLTPAHDIDGYY